MAKNKGTDPGDERRHSGLGLSSDGRARAPAHEEEGKVGPQLPFFDEARCGNFIRKARRYDTSTLRMQVNSGEKMKDEPKVILPAIDRAAT